MAKPCKQKRGEAMLRMDCAGHHPAPAPLFEASPNVRTKQKTARKRSGRDRAPAPSGAAIHQHPAPYQKLPAACVRTKTAAQQPGSKATRGSWRSHAPHGLPRSSTQHPAPYPKLLSACVSHEKRPLGGGLRSCWFGNDQCKRARTSGRLGQNAFATSFSRS